MIQIKKTILTLVALLAVTTGAWAQTGENIFQYCYDCQRNPAYPKTTASTSLSGFANPLVGYNGSGFEVVNTPAGPWKLEYMGIWSTTNQYGIEDFRVSNYQSIYNCTDVPVFRLYQWNATANEYQHASYGVVCAYAKVTNAVEHTAFFEAAEGWGCVLTNSSHSSSMNITFDEDLTTGLTTLIAAASPAAAGTPVDIAWDAATKTGTFTQPAGNVTVSVEYYPQATLAFQGLTAAVDAAAKTEAPLAVLADGAVTGGTLMYYVAPDKNFTQADAIALAETQWSADIPTAETIDAAGTCYVWYYIKGDAEHSDTDPQPLPVTLLPEPTYTVEFAEGTPESDKWKAEPAADVKKGQTVTVTYTGSKKVIGVKAEKKASAILLDNTMTAWTAGTYAVPAGGLTYSDAITVSGDVTLTLTDGETLTLNKGISLASGATLTIQGTGTMNVNGTNNSTASTVAGSGTLVLTSGTLTAKGGNGGSIDEDNAYSNGSAGGVAINGNVVVNGGTLTATGGNGGSVGSWSAYCNGGAGGAAISGDLTINSGTVTSTNGANGQLGEGTMDSSAGAGGKAVEGTVTDNR